MAAQPYIGTVMMFGGNFAPVGWAICDGQLLSIAENSPLFALIGTTYGGDGVTTFALPDLRGRVPVHQSSVLLLGQSGGEEQHTLTASEIAAHTHFLGNNAGATGLNPALSAPATAAKQLYAPPPSTGSMAPSIGLTGGNQPHNNLQPYLTLNFCIALEGIFPPRN